MYYDRELGVIFASGNLPDAYTVFSEQHQCNKYCDYYKIPREYGYWGDLRVNTLAGKKDSKAQPDADDGQ